MSKIALLISIILFSKNLFCQVKVYEGAWFEIKYPSSFTPKPSLKSTSSSEGYDSVFFTSPDGLVEFYIFSPQRGGNPTDILLKSTEKIASTKTETSGTKIIKQWTISAKDGGYIRSYQATKNNSENTNWVIGIKYKNQSSYNKYKKQYLAFKSSLKQFAD